MSHLWISTTHERRSNQSTTHKKDTRSSERRENPRYTTQKH